MREEGRRGEGVQQQAPLFPPATFAFAFAFAFALETPGTAFVPISFNHR